MDFTRRMREILEGYWKDCTTLELAKERVLIDRVPQGVAPETSTWVRDRLPKTAEQAAELAVEFCHDRNWDKRKVFKRKRKPWL